MAGGIKKHQKLIACPRRWCLGKLAGIYAPKTSSGPHKTRESIPLAILLRNRLHYAITYDEVKLIVMQKLIKVDGKIRCDRTFPCGHQDVITIDKTNEHFRMLLDTKGRFTPHKITAEEASFKLCKVRKVVIGKKGIPYAYLTDGRTVRYCHPTVSANDTLKIDLATGKPNDHVKFEIGALAMITAGRSVGRVGKIIQHDHHAGNIDMVHLKDARGDAFCTRIDNVFVIGRENKSLITLLKDKGVKKSPVELQQEAIHH